MTSIVKLAFLTAQKIKVKLTKRLILFRARRAYRWNFPPTGIFVAHSSPHFISERGEEVHVGFDAFVLHVLRTKPKFFIYGYQHLDQKTRVGENRVIGIYG